MPGVFNYWVHPFAEVTGPKERLTGLVDQCLAGKRFGPLLYATGGMELNYWATRRCGFDWALRCAEFTALRLIDHRKAILEMLLSEPLLDGESSGRRAQHLLRRSPLQR